MKSKDTVITEYLENLKSRVYLPNCKAKLVGASQWAIPDIKYTGYEVVITSINLPDNCDSVILEIPDFVTSILHYNNATEMFPDVRHLKLIGGANLYSASRLMVNCKTLETVDLTEFNPNKLVYVNGMFAECTRLKRVDISHWKCYRLFDMSDMFYACSSLKSVKMPGIEFNSLRYMNRTFDGCSELETVEFGDMRTPGIIELDKTFSNCCRLKEIIIKNCETPELETIDQFVSGCIRLEYLDLGDATSKRIPGTHKLFQIYNPETVVNMPKFTKKHQEFIKRGHWLI